MLPVDPWSVNVLVFVPEHTIPSPVMVPAIGVGLD